MIDSVKMGQLLHTSAPKRLRLPVRRRQANSSLNVDLLPDMDSVRPLCSHRILCARTGRLHSGNALLERLES